MKRQQAIDSQPHSQFSEEHEGQDSASSVLGSVAPALQKYVKLPKTINADAITHPIFFKLHIKIAIVLFITMYLLRVLPHPLIYVKEAGVSKGEYCNTSQCTPFQGNTQQVYIKKVNTFNRELKLFIELDQLLIKQMESRVKDLPKKIQIYEQILSVSIYSLHNNQIQGDPLFACAGQDLYEVIFDGQAMIYAGEIHVLNQGAYLMRVHKKQYDIISTSPSNETLVKTYSIPLKITSTMYAQFYTVVQLVLRYITLLLILYCIAQTSSSPVIFHLLLILISNPLIFTEVAFPNVGSNILSSLCASSYILYSGIYTGYTDRGTGTLGVVRKIGKGVGVLAVYIVNVISMQHLVQKTIIYIVETTLILLLLVPLWHYLWRLYFVEQDRILHRDAIFIMLTCYYFSLLFFSGYIVEYGWQKLVYYVIIQVYGVNLCYLTTRYHWSGEHPNQVSVDAKEMPCPLKKQHQQIEFKEFSSSVKHNTLEFEGHL